MRICVVTSYTASAEPRAPRHAIAARCAFPSAEIFFVDLAPSGQEITSDPAALGSAEIRRQTLLFPTRNTDAPRLLWRKLATGISRVAFRASGNISPALFGDRVQGLTAALRELSADIYIAHNIETLLPAFIAAEGRGQIIFDSMEYYADMGDAQSISEKRATWRLQHRLLPRCSLVLASSDELADALEREHGVTRPLASYNVPPTCTEVPPRIGGGFNLYWRNSVVDFGQRGLDDAFVALSMLPDDVRLFLQGRPSVYGEGRLWERAASLDVHDRVVVLPPFAPREAVSEAARYDVGLCLERPGPRNHELTVSNKMFDYHMAGLAVMTSDMPSLRRVVTRSQGGLTYQAGNPQSLASELARLRSSPDMLKTLQYNARSYALREGNLERELCRLSQAFRQALPPSPERTEGFA